MEPIADDVRAFIRALAAFQPASRLLGKAIGRAL
jgi:hypothetical protein